MLFDEEKEDEDEDDDDDGDDGFIVQQQILSDLQQRGAGGGYTITAICREKKSPLEKGTTGEREVHLGSSAFPAQGMSLGVPQLWEDPGQQ